jgi:hypothetical protein
MAREIGMWEGKVYGHEVSEYGREHGYLDYRTLAEIVGDMVLCNGIVQYNGWFEDWELENGADYDEENDYLWVIDSNSNKDKPQYLGYTVYLFNGDATELLTTYYVGDFANWNPESICVDKKNGCIWIADDCGDEGYSILHKVKFTNL